MLGRHEVVFETDLPPAICDVRYGPGVLCAVSPLCLDVSGSRERIGSVCSMLDAPMDEDLGSTLAMADNVCTLLICKDTAVIIMDWRRGQKGFSR
jgi:hypothetical protein